MVTVGPVHALRPEPVAADAALRDHESTSRRTSGGVDSAPNPAELLLAALAGCVTTGIATNAALFDVPIDAMSIEMEADIDVRGMLGHDKSVRNGITDIRYTVTIQSPASEEQGAPVQGDHRPEVSGAGHAGQSRQHHVEARLPATLSGCPARSTAATQNR